MERWSQSRARLRPTATLSGVVQTERYRPGYIHLAAGLKLFSPLTLLRLPAIGIWITPFRGALTEGIENGWLTSSEQVVAQRFLDGVNACQPFNARARLWLHVLY